MTNSFINNKLKELEEISSNSKFWNITKEQGEILSSLVLKKQPKNILEIGTSNGYSTLYLIKNLDSSSKLTTIEVNDERYDIAKKNFEELNLNNITQIKGEIIDLLTSDKIKGEFDFVFIDAAQKFYTEIFELLKGKELLTNTSTIVFDNITSHNMTEFVNKMQEKYDCELKEIGGGLLIVNL